MRPRRTLARLCAGVLGLSACGYSAGSLVPEDARSVFLPGFGNDTFWRDLEVELTRAVARELESRPGIFIVPREDADIVLTGTIVRFAQRVLSEDDRDRVRESSATTTVRIEIRDGPTGRVRESFQLVDQAEFILARGENLAQATGESFVDLARRIVDQLETDFPRASGLEAGLN